MTWQALSWRAATVVDRPLPVVAQTLSSVQLWRRTAAVLGSEMVEPEPDSERRTWAPGDRVALAGSRNPSASSPMVRSPIRRSAMTGGPLARPPITAVWRQLPPLGQRAAGPEADWRCEVLSGVGRGGQLRISLAATGAGTLVTAEFGNPNRARGAGARLRAVSQARFRRRVIAGLEMLLGMIRLDLHQGSLVVAGALIRDGTVLATRRTHPPELAGRWEFPGGKASRDEAPTDALRRELREELGLEVEVGEQLAADVSIDVELVLRLYQVRLATSAHGTGDAAEPIPTEHDQVRWLTAAELGAVDWLDADRALLPAVRERLR